MKKAVILGIILSLVIGLFVVNHVQAYSNSQQESATLIVDKGDTLWGIANQHRGKTDVRKYIYQIQKINDIGTTIYPGQELILP